MSTSGGIHQILTTSSQQDKILTATDFLKKRISLIQEQKKSDNSSSDELPTLMDLQKTHMLFMVANHKPYAAIGSEYQKADLQTTNAELGGQLRFNIPKFGDFFSDMVVHIKVRAPTINRASNFDLTSDNEVDPTQGGNQSAAAFRWCAFPGERLFQKVSFTIQGNEIDEYTSVATNFYRETQLPSNKLVGWYRAVGQELPKKGYFDQPGVDSSGDNLGSTGRSGIGKDPINHRLRAELLNGYQTPKAVGEDLDLWIPLLFWFNLDFRLMLPSVAIPVSQRYINIDLATGDQMYGLVPRGIGTWQDPKATLSTPSNQVSKVELYINNLFVQPEIHNIYIKQIGFHLVRLHREQTASISDNEGKLFLNQLRWPTETMYIGISMNNYRNQSVHLDKWHKYSTTTNTRYRISDLGSYHHEMLTTTTWTYTANTELMSMTGNITDELEIGEDIVFRGITSNIQTTPVFTGGNTEFRISPAPVNNLTGTAEDPISKITYPSVVIPEETTNLTQISLLMHGVEFYKNMPNRFFNDYTTLNRGGPFVNSPHDVGMVYIPFNLFPGIFQPSGYLNILNSSDLSLEYTAENMSSSNNGTMYIITKALNLLIIDEDDASLRFT